MCRINLVNTLGVDHTKPVKFRKNIHSAGRRFSDIEAVTLQCLPDTSRCSIFGDVIFGQPSGNNRGKAGSANLLDISFR